MSYVLLKELEERMAKMHKMVKEMDLENVTDEEVERLKEDIDLAGREMDLLLPYYEFVKDHEDFLGG